MNGSGELDRQTISPVTATSRRPVNRRHTYSSVPDVMDLCAFSFQLISNAIRDLGWKRERIRHPLGRRELHQNTILPPIPLNLRHRDFFRRNSFDGP